MAHSNISIFVTHVGCPHLCAFCDQRTITGSADLPSGEDVRRICAEQSPAHVWTDDFLAIPEADAAKYVPEDKCYCKILVNGQEPDTRGVRSVNENGAVWGAVLCILERMKSTAWKEDFSWNFDASAETLTVTCADGRCLVAGTHRTHLLVDGQENLMDGEPYLSPEGQLVMEVSAIAPWLPHTSSRYDEKVNVLRIERI